MAHKRNHLFSTEERIHVGGYTVCVHAILCVTENLLPYDSLFNVLCFTFCD